MALAQSISEYRIQENDMKKDCEQIETEKVFHLKRFKLDVNQNSFGDDGYLALSTLER